MLEKVSEILLKVCQTATRANLLYVVCIWRGPFSEINYRVGYFDNVAETLMFGTELKKCYAERYHLPFVIYSSINELDNLGNLFD